jgi:nitroreductase
MGRDNIIVLFGVRMDVMEIIKSRKSVRTFNGEKITDDDKEN